MGMRDYHNLKDIIIPEAQEKIMDIYCEAWDDCRDMGHCKDCPDRQMLKEKFSLLECFSLKYSRMLIEEGYAPVVHGRWEFAGALLNGASKSWKCSVCGGVSPKVFSFCPNCGAKMDEEEKHG